MILSVSERTADDGTLTSRVMNELTRRAELPQTRAEVSSAQGLFCETEIVNKSVLTPVFLTTNVIAVESPGSTTNVLKFNDDCIVVGEFNPRFLNSHRLIPSSTIKLDGCRNIPHR